ncbi:Equilibrative nucleoside transporter 4 [Halotydeus destructor]|nr:Equilibrative nucleoside transporter 4 [Halotydeus destructor]
MPFGIDDDDLDSYQPPLVSGSTGRSIDSLHHAMDSVGRLDSTESTDPDDIFGLERATRVDSGTAKVDLVTRMVNAKESVKIRVKRNVNSAWQRMTYRLGTRMQAISLTWPYMVAIATAYLVTLSLFPGIETEILSCRLGTWMPVLLMAVFNLTDFIGKIAASFFYTMSPLTLVTMAAARIVFVPLLSLAVAPRADPILHHEAWSFVLTIGLGLTNGVFGSLPMILAPLHVPSDLKELTGNLMTLSYSLGLTAGSALAYLIDWLLGPSLNRKFIEHLCDHMAHLSSAILTNSTSGFLYNNQTIL